MALTDLKGIGPTTAEKLRKAGIATEKGLARADPERVAKVTGRSMQQAEAWVDAAWMALGNTPIKPISSSAFQGTTQPGTPRPKDDGRRIAGQVLLGLDLGYLALTMLFGAILLLVLLVTGTDLVDLVGESESSPESSRAILWINNVHNAIVFGIIPVAWAALAHTGGWQGVRRVLGLTGGWNNVLYGTFAGIAMVIVLGGISLLMEQAGLAPEEAPIVDLVAAITWPLVIVTSLVAGVAEEIMFRGVLQRWLKWWGQGLAFGALHLGNAGIFSFVATAAIGIGFGYARHRGVSLWTLIVAHFVYDFILLSTVILYPELAGVEESAIWLGWLR